MHRLSLLFLLLTLTLFSQINPAHACIGSPDGTFSVLVINSSHTIIAGRIFALSDSGVNAVVEVEQVLQGAVEHRYVMLLRNSLSDVQAYTNSRGLVSPCETRASDLIQGRRFIATVSHNTSGIYTGIILVMADENDNFPDGRINETISYEDALDEISTLVDEISYTPQIDTKPRPVMITLFTESQQYIVPVDNLELVEPYLFDPCISWIGGSPEPCTQKIYAPNGYDNVSLYPIGTGHGGYTIMNHPFSYAIDGDDAVFSPDSDLLTVWHGNELRSYATTRQRGFNTNSYNDGLTRIGSLFFPHDDTLISGAGAWSPDGRTFAFSSENGVWLWDALVPAALPELLVPAGNTPVIVRHFSPARHYLALESESRRFNIDIHTAKEYPDGIFSFNDRLLAVYDTQTSDVSLQIYSVLPSFEPLYTEYLSGVSQFEWIGNQNMIYVQCNEASNDSSRLPYPPSCTIKKIDMHIEVEQVNGIQFDYDPMTESLVTLVGDYTINLNGETLYLREMLDSPILRIEISPAIDIRHRDY